MSKIPLVPKEQTYPHAPQYEPQPQEPQYSMFDTVYWYNQTTENSQQQYFHQQSTIPSSYSKTLNNDEEYDTDAKRWSCCEWSIWLFGLTIILVFFVGFGFLTYYAYGVLLFGSEKPLPLVSVGSDAYGIFAIGSNAVGVVSVGFFSVGFITIGFLCFGLVNIISFASIGLLYSFGMFSGGYGVVIGQFVVCGYSPLCQFGLGFIKLQCAHFGIHILAPWFRKNEKIFVNSCSE